MNLHKHQFYLLEQHSESFKIRSAIIRINTEGKSLIMKLGPVVYCRILRGIQKSRHKNVFEVKKHVCAVWTARLNGLT